MKIVSGKIFSSFGVSNKNFLTTFFSEKKRTYFFFFYVWLHPKIEMFILAKLLSIVCFKELVFTKYLFIYLLQ